MILRLLSVLLLALPAAASAGTRAVYAGGGRGQIEMLIADNGDASIALDRNRRVIVRGGVGYIVSDRLTGPIVTRVADLEAELRTHPAMPRAATPAAVPLPAVVAMGRKSVNGREGDAYGFASAAGREVVLVVSGDPRLAPVGRAFRETMAAMEVLSDAGSDIREGRDLIAPFARLLEGKTPLQIATFELKSVEPADVPAEALALPAPPETAEALRARIAREAEAEKGPHPQTMISHAAFAAGRLWLLTDTGTLSSLAEGESVRRTEAPGGYVLGLCATTDGPLALIGAAKGGGAWTLRRWRSGHWVSAGGVAHGSDFLVAFGCTGGAATIVTDARLIGPGSKSVPLVRSAHDRLLARVRAVAYGAPDRVYVGLDAGEWGGGLRAIDRASGRVQILERKDTPGPCGLPLDSGCDPVNGIAPIPWRPGCIAAAVGLIHFDSAGRIVAVCGREVELLYARRHEEAPPRAGQPEEAGGFGSVAFFGIAASGGRLLAVGDDGLYRFGPDGRAEHQKWPLFKQVDGVLVSFALPDAVLVMTTVNARASVSGITPLLVPR